LSAASVTGVPSVLPHTSSAAAAQPSSPFIFVAHTLRLAVGAFLFSALSSRVDAFSAWVQGCSTGRPDSPALVVHELNENLLLSAIGRSDLNSPRIIFQVRNIYIYN
jgi:hypothetical protein